MPLWWRIAALIVPALLAQYTFFGFDLKWQALNDALTSADVWMLNNAAYPSLFALAVGLFLGLCLIPEVGFFILRQLRAPAFWEWQKEHDRLAEEDRGIFFQRSQSAYETWKRDRAEAPADMQDLIGVSEFPAAVLLSEQSDLRFVELESSLAPNSRLLVDFVEAIYPPERSDKSKVLGDAEVEQFNEARRRLAKFWNATGRKVFGARTLGLWQLRRNMSTHAAELKFLTYLDWALARRLHTDGAGKQGIFRLCAASQQRK